MNHAFEALGLSQLAMDAVRKKGFEEPSEIQKKAIPLLLESKRDIIAQAQTGTGKTATFGLVFTDKLTPKKSKSPQVIVLTPTRELALQVSEELNSLKGDKDFSIVPIYGGQSWSMQQRHLKAGVDIVVGTPGRIIDHLERGTLKIENIEYFVLDEADEMLNMGFIEEIEKILEYVKERKQTLLFSATMPKRIELLARKYMTDPILIQTTVNQIANNAVDQIYFEVGNRDKFDALCRIIDMEELFYGIIFCRTKIDSDDVTKHLNDRGYRAEAFHGDISQERREQVLGNFRKRRTEILVATDVAARGIDITDLTHVINYSLPQNSESYVHRIGRTGRAGKTGKAITLITPNEYRKLRMFERAAKADIQKSVLPTAAHMVDLKKKKIVKDIVQHMETSDLSMYKKVAQELFGDMDAEIVVASFLKECFSDSLNENSYKSIQQSGKGNQRSERNNTQENRGNELRMGAEYGTARLFLTTGHNDKATPQKILQMIEDDFGVSRKVIGAIDIMTEYSFITVPLQEAENILDAFQALKKKQRPAVRIERASVDRKRGGDSRRKSSKSSGGRKKRRS